MRMRKISIAACNRAFTVSVAMDRVRGSFIDINSEAACCL